MSTRARNERGGRDHAERFRVSLRASAEGFPFNCLLVAIVARKHFDALQEGGAAEISAA